MPASGNTLVHSLKGRFGGHDQRPAFVQLGDDLEDELGGAVGQGELAELVQARNLGACVAPHDAGELLAAFGR
jgi:hypothetical protein